jgi:thioredoxin 1
MDVGTDENFPTLVLAAELPVVVDFWAPHCQPCIGINRILAELAPQYSGKLAFVSVNVEMAPEVAATYGVRGLPHLVLFAGGHITLTRLGTLSRKALEALLAEAAKNF